ncbi:MAG: EpsI family protein [Nitrospirales bacterium]|nr:EpsI family protein [Nitrospirales bacterium]
MKRYSVVYLLIIVSAFFVHFREDITVPMNKAFSEFPLQAGGWRMVSESSFSDAVLDVLKPTAYLARDYSDGENTVHLYIGYHSGGKGSGEIHSPKHCLPGSGWFSLSEKKTELTVGDRNLKVVKAVYQLNDRKELFLYWYQVKGSSIADEYSLKLAEIVNSFLYSRKDAAFIRISVPIEADEERAYALAERFVKEFYPIINNFLP